MFIGKRNVAQYRVPVESVQETSIRGSTVKPVEENEGILLANLLQSSRSTFSWGSFPSFFAFQEGMWDTQISALLSSPTVSPPILETSLFVNLGCNYHSGNQLYGQSHILVSQFK